MSQGLTSQVLRPTERPSKYTVFIFFLFKFTFSCPISVSQGSASSGHHRGPGAGKGTRHHFCIWVSPAIRGTLKELDRKWCQWLGGRVGQRQAEGPDTVPSIHLSPQPNGKLGIQSGNTGLSLARCVTLGEHPPLSGLLFPPVCGMVLGNGNCKSPSGLGMPQMGRKRQSEVILLSHPLSILSSSLVGGAGAGSLTHSAVSSCHGEGFSGGQERRGPCSGGPG